MSPRDLINHNLVDKNEFRISTQLKEASFSSEKIQQVLFFTSTSLLLLFHKRIKSLSQATEENI